MNLERIYLTIYWPYLYFIGNWAVPIQNPCKMNGNWAVPIQNLYEINGNWAVPIQNLYEMNGNWAVSIQNPCKMNGNWAVPIIPDVILDKRVIPPNGNCQYPLNHHIFLIHALFAINQNSLFVINTYICPMIPLRYLFFLALLLITFGCNLVVKETDDYIMEETDIDYYNNHGPLFINYDDDYILDSTTIHYENGILKLPLENGKFVEIYGKDPKAKNIVPIDGSYGGENKKTGYYLFENGKSRDIIYYLVNRKDGQTIVSNLFQHISPSGLYYGNVSGNFTSHWRYDGVEFTNIKTNKTVRISLPNEDPSFFYWINDTSFEFHTWSYLDKKHNDILDKYYLVHIKHRKQ